MAFKSSNVELYTQLSDMKQNGPNKWLHIYKTNVQDYPLMIISGLEASQNASNGAHPHIACQIRTQNTISPNVRPSSDNLFRA